jgi:threonine/homoserine/homoserine lactone efflux protein
VTAESTLAFALAVGVFAAVPGPAILACISQALAHGFRGAMGLMLGIILGDVIFLLLAVFGLSAVAHALGAFFVVVKVLGGAYLIWLGWCVWRRDPVASLTDPRPMGPRSLWAGLLVTLSNPKVILFYMGFLPAFMDLASLRWRDVLLTVSVLLIVLTSVNSAYALGASWLRRVVATSRAVRRLDRGAGSLMIGTGAYVMTR